MVISPSPLAGESRVRGCYGWLDPSDEAIGRAQPPLSPTLSREGRGSQKLLRRSGLLLINPGGVAEACLYDNMKAAVERMLSVQAQPKSTLETLAEDEQLHFPPWLDEEPVSRKCGTQNSELVTMRPSRVCPLARCANANTPTIRPCDMRVAGIRLFVLRIARESLKQVTIACDRHERAKY
jgi:hypothetical protein